MPSNITRTNSNQPELRLKPMVFTASMSQKYKGRDQEKIYFITFAVVQWVDVFTRREYKNLLVERLQYCQREKGLEIYAWCSMLNHLHLCI